MIKKSFQVAFPSQLINWSMEIALKIWVLNNPAPIYFWNGGLNFRYDTKTTPYNQIPNIVF